MKTSVIRGRGLLIAVFGVLGGLLLFGGTSSLAKEQKVTRAKTASVSIRGSAKEGGPIEILSNGFSNPPSYETGSPSSTIGYVKVCLSKTSPTPPTTTWYLDGVSKGTVSACASAVFKATSRTGHTVSFTCAGNNRPPAPVSIDLQPKQKVTIQIYYQ
jgi:hypothetical protein